MLIKRTCIKNSKTIHVIECYETLQYHRMLIFLSQTQKQGAKNTTMAKLNRPKYIGY